MHNHYSKNLNMLSLFQFFKALNSMNTHITFQICNAYLLLQMGRGYRDSFLQVLYKQQDAWLKFPNKAKDIICLAPFGFQKLALLGCLGISPLKLLRFFSFSQKVVHSSSLLNLLSCRKVSFVLCCFFHKDKSNLCAHGKTLI